MEYAVKGLGDWMRGRGGIYDSLVREAWGRGAGERAWMRDPRYSDEGIIWSHVGERKVLPLMDKG